jgi:apolipoprotein N-acyltransferase
MMNYSRIKNLSFALSSGLLLVLAWPPFPFNFLIFFAFVPLFWCAVETKKATQFFWQTFFAMLIWNVGTTWWVCNSTLVGGISAIIANSLLMCIPWIAYYKARQFFHPILALFGFLSFWLCFEYIHLNWELSWPWLTLGNVFANNTHFIQWYSYTGVAGGSLFILLENILFFVVIQKWQSNNSLKNWLPSAGLFFMIPILLWIWSSVLEKNNNQQIIATKNMVAVQPNIDPYQKFSLGTASTQINQLLQLTKESVDSNTAWILWPETAMSVGEWQDLVTQNNYYQSIFQFIQQHPTLSLLSGIETYKNYGVTKATNTARKMDNGNYYDAFNAAIHIQANQPPDFYNKSKLVPGVESLPSFLNVLAPVFEKFGGSTGGYGRSDTPIVFRAQTNNYVIAPIICYESIYGDYVREYVKDGATVLGIITNDGWWGNTPGYKQHLAYAKLRAIENRRWVVRSANTGVSAIINERGDIVQQLDWDKTGAIKMNIPIIPEQTFYTKQGDYIYEMAQGASFIILLGLCYVGVIKRIFPNKPKP